MRVPSMPQAVLAALILIGGCAGRPLDPSWGAHWPSPADLGEAAATAARSPGTWAPLATAAVLSIDDLDEEVSDWGADQTPVFGSDAKSASDDLRSVAHGAWLVSALAAPSRNLTDKASGLAVGAATLLLETGVTEAIKNASDRARPDRTDHNSFTSGHAGTASAAATLARHNLDDQRLPGWLDTSLRIGLHGVALGTGWARVEAEKHHVTDVLGGYAVGHFVASFMHHAFMVSGLPPVEVRYLPLEGGGAVTVVFRAP